VWFPSAEPRLGIHPSVALWKDKGVSPSAEGDRRSRRLRRAFEKARAKLSIRHRRDAPINCNFATKKRPSRAVFLISVFIWCRSIFFFENAVKIVIIFKSYCACYGGDSNIGMPQHH